MNNEINDMAKDLKGQLKRLELVGNGAFKEMDPKKYSKVAGVHADLNQAMRAARTGDTSKLNQLAEKYARTN